MKLQSLGALYTKNSSNKNRLLKNENSAKAFNDNALCLDCIAMAQSRVERKN